jgi:hypothetical protein
MEQRYITAPCVHHYRVRVSQRLVGLVRVGDAWTRDVQTARRELEASGSQAFVLAAHALAWRLAVVTLPVAVAASGWFVVHGDARASVLLIAAALGGLGPQMAAFLLTFPVDFFASAQTLFRGSRDARLRFGITNFVYPYYGWRYAFRGRTRPWGALTKEERIRVNPGRAGVQCEPPARRNYWPE